MMALDTLKQRISYQSLLLAGFALISSALLGVADYNTRDVIQLRQQEDLQASLSEVIPGSYYDNNLLQDTVLIASESDGIGADETQVYIGRQNGQVSAISFRLLTLSGYSGEIDLIMGIDKDGNILGVRVISHAETPGLGDKIEISKSDWILSFNGHSLTNLSLQQWAVKKDGGEFDQFSGATITPRAIVIAVYQGLKFFQRHQAEILNS